MKKPYIKKIETISKFNVWIVDGQYVRTKIDEEFTNFGQHYRFKFIPKNEFWIDRESAPGEAKFFIDHMLVENRLMAEGKSYAVAIERADVLEKKERNKSAIVKRWKGREARDIVENKVHKKLLKKYSKDLKVWVVSGEAVRDFFRIDFTEGGHDMVYSFVPAREVWLDDDLSIKERKFVLLHEVHERHLMAKGWTYNDAHRDSSKIEFYCRHHRKALDKKIEQEIEKNKII